MEASFFSKPLSQSECRIKIISQLLSESECRHLGCDLTQKTQTNKIAEVRHNADKHYLLQRPVDEQQQQQQKQQAQLQMEQVWRLFAIFYSPTPILNIL